MKGYGTFQTKMDDPTGPYTVFSAAPTSATNTKVEVQGFSGDDLTNLRGVGINDPDAVDSFYWGPSAKGIQTVSISAFLKNLTTGETTTLTSSSQTNVVQPKGKMTATLGTAGLSTGGATMDGYQYIGIDKGATITSDWRGNPTITGPYGIVGKATLISASIPPGVTGTFGVVQTITTNETKSFYAPASGIEGTQYQQLTLSDGTSPSGPSLDNSFPYSGRIGSTTGNPAINPVVNFEDNPAVSVNNFGYLSTPIDLSRSDSFTDTLMFNPGGIWVPLGSLTWNWSASASYNSTTSTWNQDSASQSSTTYVPAGGNGDFPVWSHNISEQTTWTTAV